MYVNALQTCTMKKKNWGSYWKTIAQNIVFLPSIVFSHIHNFSIFFLHWISITGKDHMHACLCTQTNTRTLLKMLSQSRLRSGLSHDLSRVWNFHSNIHENRLALHHLCVSSWVLGIKNKKKWGEEKIHFNRGEKQERERTKQREETGSQGSSGWGHTCVSLRRRLSQLARHDFTTASMLADDRTHADGVYAIQH